MMAIILYCLLLSNPFFMENKQEQFWSGQFGKEYTDRNTISVKAIDEAYKNQFGHTRSHLNYMFLLDCPRLTTSILEVGCNTGMQLMCLQNMGFKKLYGIELQPYAVQKAKEQTEGINIIQGSAFDLPFMDNYFDVVFTSGVLIHIDPQEIHKVMSEMYRVSKRFIWGFEYYSEKLKAINYRGNEGFLWKADYAQMFLDKYKDLKVYKKTLLPYETESEKGNVDCMYILEKG